MKRWQAVLILVAATAAICGFMYWKAEAPKSLDPAEQERIYYDGMAIPAPPQDRAAGGK